MLGKKLLTLACAVGILSFGACFPIPIGRQQPLPPPSVRSGLQGVRDIRVVVVNLTDVHVDLAVLAQAVASDINSMTDETGIRANAQSKPSSEDAVLEITIFSATATPYPPADPLGFQRWSFAIRASAKVTDNGGKILCSALNLQYARVKRLSAQNPAEAWRDGEIQDWARFKVASRLVKSILYGQ